MYLCDAAEVAISIFIAAAVADGVIVIFQEPRVPESLLAFYTNVLTVELSLHHKQ